MSRVNPIPYGYCAYLTRKMPLAMRDRLHALVRSKQKEGFEYHVEDVVNAALEIGVGLMEQTVKRQKWERGE